MLKPRVRPISAIDVIYTDYMCRINGEDAAAVRLMSAPSLGLRFHLLSYDGPEIGYRLRGSATLPMYLRRMSNAEVIVEFEEHGDTLYAARGL